jgi:hypothetical protein
VAVCGFALGCSLADYYSSRGKEKIIPMMVEIRSVFEENKKMMLGQLTGMTMKKHIYLRNPVRSI